MTDDTQRSTETTDEQSIEERIEALESIIERQQETIERQENRIDELVDDGPAAPTSSENGTLPVGRRGVLQAGGALALLGLGAGTASAQTQPQGQVGTADRPLNALHTVDLEATDISAENDGDEDGTTAIEGRATAGAGETCGLSGIAESADPSAAAVRANAPNGAIGFDAISNGNYAIKAEATDYSAVKAETSGEHYNAIHGVNNATSGWSWGVRGDTASQSENAYGVRGVATTTEGAATGVGGETEASGDGAAGVSGYASASGVEAATKGVEGVTDADADNSPSPEIVPAGVEGTTTGDGTTHGVRGVSESVNGRGVAGFATSDDYDHSSYTGSGIGVSGVTDLSGDDEGVVDAGGVFGMAAATSGTAYGVLGRSNTPDGWGVRGMDTSGSGYGVYSSGDSKTDGDHETTGDTELGGELAFADETPQRTAGPIAKGHINADGSIENAVNVASAQWHSGEERYRIGFANEHYFFNNYVTVVTPVNHAQWRITSNSGDLIVEFEDSNGNAVQRGFQFVTHKLPNGTVTTTGETVNSSEHSDTLTSDEPNGAADPNS